MAEQNQTGALLVGLEKVSHLVSRCNMYEALYRTSMQGEEALTDLERSLVGLYTVILEFLATASRFVAKCGPLRAVHAVFNPDEVAKFVEDCEKQALSLEAAASNCERALQQHAHTAHSADIAQLQLLLAKLHAPLVRVDDHIEALLVRSSESERCAILQWVSSIPYESNHFAAKKGRTHGTAEWILAHSKFREWRATSASTLLWLHGIRKSPPAYARCAVSLLRV